MADLAGQATAAGDGIGGELQACVTTGITVGPPRVQQKALSLGISGGSSGAGGGQDWCMETGTTSGDVEGAVAGKAWSNGNVAVENSGHIWTSCFEAGAADVGKGRDAGSEDACNISLVETLLYPFPKVVWCSALNQCVLLCANARWTS